MARWGSGNSRAVQRSIAPVQIRGRASSSRQGDMIKRGKAAERRPKWERRPEAPKGTVRRAAAAKRPRERERATGIRSSIVRLAAVVLVPTNIVEERPFQRGRKHGGAAGWHKGRPPKAAPRTSEGPKDLAIARLRTYIRGVGATRL